jgi:hypothetical protein
VGVVPRQVVVVEGVKGVKYAPMLPEIYKNGEKMGGFPHFLVYKLLRTPFFAQKYFTRYTPETFYTCSKFWKSFMLPAALIRVKSVAVAGSPLKFCLPFEKLPAQRVLTVRIFSQHPRDHKYQLQLSS